MSKIFSLDSRESLTKISDQNALEYLDSGKNFIMDRLRFEFLEQREQRINPKIYSLPSRDKNNLKVNLNYNLKENL